MSYDPDGQFSIVKTFAKLEHAGIKILTSLKDNLSPNEQEQSEADCLRRVLNRLKDEGHDSLTWRSLLDTLQAMNLGDLSQLIDDYLTGTL